jgi:protein SCO1/2
MKIKPAKDNPAPPPGAYRHGGVPTAAQAATMILCCGAAVSLLFLAACRRQQPALPVLSEIPPFALTAENGQAFDSSQLKGQPWIADFIFTNCPGACLRMSHQMSAVQQRSSARLISFTVDPDRDTPAILAAYAKRYQADPARWRFLTGPRDQLDVLGAAFLIGKISLDHSTRFALVDRDMRLRATYQTNEPDAVERLLKDVAALEGQ